MNFTWKRPSVCFSARLTHLLGLCAAGAAICFWVYVLRSPGEPAAQPADSMARADDPAGAAVAGWFEPGQVRLNIAVQGLILRHDRAVALLAINGAAPRAYIEGEELLRGVTLDVIDAAGVTIGQADGTLRLAAPALPARGISGIERVR
ncbi:hypothetical protein HC231_12965 [Brenneria izadpanahii]|uniref:General secretion pathway protein GspC n=1 Tax=Brenneria izadpanahii TaxID=2722756 RepID=A0ABX7USQ8_9GAMM|nr:hypothetical protein [Brenneria izadpanahii]QTF08711.1 hypothetical protein HC231_12965 [Brenneria izadpanahii]